MDIEDYQHQISIVKEALKSAREFIILRALDRIRINILPDTEVEFLSHVLKNIEEAQEPLYNLGNVVKLTDNERSDE